MAAGTRKQTLIQGTLQGLRLSYAQWKFRSDKVSINRFYFKLATLLERGSGMMSALSAIKESLEGTSSPVPAAIEAWAPKIRDGQDFSSYAVGWVPSSDLLFIKAGEQSASLPHLLRRLVGIEEQKREVTDVVQKSMAKPVVIFLIVIGILELFGVVVFPELLKSVNEMHMIVQFSPISGSLITLSTFVSHYGFIFPVVVISIVAVVLWALPNLTHPVRIALDRRWPFSLYRTMQGAVVMLALGSLAETGMSPRSALQLISQNATPYLRHRLGAIIFCSRHGEFIGEAMRLTGLWFPDREIIAEMKIYTTDSDYGEALTRLADDWVKSTVRKLRSTAQQMEVYLNLILYAVLGWLMGGVLMISRDINLATSTL